MRYLSNQSRIDADENAAGVHHPQPRVARRRRATLGNRCRKPPNPEGVVDGCSPEPLLNLRTLSEFFPTGSLGSQGVALGCNLQTLSAFTKHQQQTIRQTYWCRQDWVYIALSPLTLVLKRLCDLNSHLRRRIKEDIGRLKRHAREYPRRTYVQLAFVLLAAGGLKYFYSTASVNQLRWILAPTTWLVESVSGDSFQFESHAGYINSKHTFLIAASCAGVNFLITAFLMLALGHLWRRRTQTLTWIFTPVTALVAYGVTLVTNTVRISTALQLRAMRVESDWLTAGQLHRFEGIFIYFGFLLLLYVVSERLTNQRSNTSEAIPERGILPTLRSYMFPLVVYYTTTLGIPLINGAFRQRDFWEHSLFVLLIPLVFILPFAGFTFMRRVSRAHKLL